jgi:hypothetical protein
MTQKPRPLDYATQVGAYPTPRPHPGIALWLIGFTVLAGVWSIILGLFYCIDWRACAGQLIAGGVLLCWATVGKLSASNIRLRSALLILTIAIGFEAGATVVANREYQRRVSQYGYQFVTPRNIRSRATAGEKEVAPYEMLRNAGGASALLGSTVWLYVAGRLVSRRPGHSEHSSTE